MRLELALTGSALCGFLNRKKKIRIRTLTPTRWTHLRLIKQIRSLRWCPRKRFSRALNQKLKFLAKHEDLPLRTRMRSNYPDSRQRWEKQSKIFGVVMIRLRLCHRLTARFKSLLCLQKLLETAHLTSSRQRKVPRCWKCTDRAPMAQSWLARVPQSGSFRCFSSMRSCPNLINSSTCKLKKARQPNPKFNLSSSTKGFTSLLSRRSLQAKPKSI